MSIRDEAFNQPLFGCNNLTFNVAPQTNWGNGLAFSVKFEFRNGGAQTFLRLFWKVMSGVNECRNAPGRSFLLLFTRSGRSRSRRDPFHLLGPIRLLRLRGPLGPHLHLHRAALHAHHRTAPLHLSRSPCPSTTPCPPTTPSPTHRRPLPTTLTTLPLLPMTPTALTLPRLLLLPRLMTPTAPTLRLLLNRLNSTHVLDGSQARDDLVLHGGRGGAQRQLGELDGEDLRVQHDGCDGICIDVNALSLEAHVHSEEDLPSIPIPTPTGLNTWHKDL